MIWCLSFCERENWSKDIFGTERFTIHLTGRKSPNSQHSIASWRRQAITVDVAVGPVDGASVVQLLQDGERELEQQWVWQPALA